MDFYERCLVRKADAAANAAIGALRVRHEREPNAFVIAVEECLVALRSKTFDAHSPAHIAVWETMAATIRPQVFVDDEQCYMLTRTLRFIWLELGDESHEDLLTSFEHEFLSAILNRLTSSQAA